LSVYNKDNIASKNVTDISQCFVKNIVFLWSLGGNCYLWGRMAVCIRCL